MRVVVVRHHAIDEAGFIADAFEARGAELTVHQFPKGGPLPSLDGVDHIVVLGAAWSVYEERISGWIGDELDWLRAADAVCSRPFGAVAPPHSAARSRPRRKARSAGRRSRRSTLR